MLAARSRGSARHGPRSTCANEAEAAELLGIPDGMTQVALIPVAYFTGDDFKPAERPPVEGITYWDTWGATAGDGSPPGNPRRPATRVRT